MSFYHPSVSLDIAIAKREKAEAKERSIREGVRASLEWIDSMKAKPKKVLSESDYDLSDIFGHLV